MSKMTRYDFGKRLTRLILLTILAAGTLFLSRRTVRGAACNSCASRETCYSDLTCNQK